MYKQSVSYYLMVIGFVVTVLGAIGATIDEGLSGMVYVVPILGGIISIVTGMYNYVFGIKNMRKKIILLFILTLSLISIPLANKYLLPGDSIFSLVTYR